MDRIEGRCWLDWWANSSTLLGSAEIAVVIAATDGGWHARGHLVSDDDEEREGFAFLCDLDPVFMLRFEDVSTIPVAVHSLDEEGWFVLTEIHRAGAAVDRPSDQAVVCAVARAHVKVRLARKELQRDLTADSYRQLVSSLSSAGCGSDPGLSRSRAGRVAR